VAVVVVSAFPAGAGQQHSRKSVLFAHGHFPDIFNEEIN
jgi:hypothetical protein